MVAVNDKMSATVSDSYSRKQQLHQSATVIAGSNIYSRSDSHSRKEQLQQAATATAGSDGYSRRQRQVVGSDRSQQLLTVTAV